MQLYLHSPNVPAWRAQGGESYIEKFRNEQRGNIAWYVVGQIVTYFGFGSQRPLVYRPAQQNPVRHGISAHLVNCKEVQ